MALVDPFIRISARISLISTPFSFNHADPAGFIRFDWLWRWMGDLYCPVSPVPDCILKGPIVSLANEIVCVYLIN